jgi:Ca-activated chloride channel family protein
MDGGTTVMRWIQRSIVGMIVLGFLAACAGPAAHQPDSGAAAAPAGALTLRMLYGSEKQAWLSEAVAAFNAAAITTADGRSIFVDAAALGSGESLDMIINGTDAADIWSPASSLYLPLAQRAWASAHGGDALIDIPQALPLVLSPVVIGMWKPMAQALGWPDRQVGWRDLADLVSSGKTWADYRHPEWGAFQFGHTHPEYSNSGLATIVAMAYAGANKTSDLTVADAQAPATAALINTVEQSVIHYGSSTGFFATAMYDRGPGYLSAAVLYENLVSESSDQTLHPTIDLPVVALYPSEGSFWSDHPFAVLNTPAMTAEKRAAAEIFRAYLLAAPQQTRALQYGFRPANLDIALTAPIDSLHGVDPTQLHAALPVPSGEVIQAIRQTWQANKKQVDVSVVVDTSGSMRQENRLREAKAALIAFLGAFADNDQVGVTIFNSAASELSPLTPLGSKRDLLRAQVGDLIANGETRLYSTIADAYQALNAQPAGQRIRALVVLTDGEDTSSSLSIDQLLEQVRASEEGTAIKIFTIAYGADANGEVLRRIADATGARSFTGDPATIMQVYREIATFF